MRTFFTAAVFIFTFTNLVQAFDQLPYELGEKIIFMEPAAIGVLSSTCKSINAYYRAWVATKDAKFIAEAGYDNNSSRLIYFVLQHNKKITEDDIVPLLYPKCGKKELSESCQKAMSAVYPWAVQRTLYKRNSSGECSDAWIKPVTSGFLIPIYYSRNKEIPMMHYFLLRQLQMDYLYKERLFERLLESGMNPYHKFEGETVVDLINGYPKYAVNKIAKEHLVTLCASEKYKRDPINPKVVMYWKKSKTETTSLTIDDVRLYASYGTSCMMSI